MANLRFINYRKEFPNARRSAFRGWFRLDRFYGGRLIHIGIRHLALSIDLRG